MVVAAVVLVDSRVRLLVRPRAVRATTAVHSRLLTSVHTVVQAVAVLVLLAPTPTVQPVLADLGTRFRVRFTRVAAAAGRWVQTS
jgi:hypothetical protein